VSLVNFVKWNVLNGRDRHYIDQQFFGIVVNAKASAVTARRWLKQQNHHYINAIAGEECGVAPRTFHFTGRDDRDDPKNVPCTLANHEDDDPFSTILTLYPDVAFGLMSVEAASIPV
jgi:hypothetical protein